MTNSSLTRYTLICLLGLGSGLVLNAADPAPAAPAAPAAPVRELGPRTNGPARMTPQDLEARRKQMRERLEKQLEELKKKKTEGNFTTNDAVRLERLETYLKRWDTMGTNRPAPMQRPAPGNRPTPPGAKPVEKPADAK